MKLVMRAACAAGILATGLALSTGAVNAQTKIGALYPFSGGLALLGDESFRGLELATEERNAAGGVKGQQLQIVKGDAVDPNQAVGEARRLTSVDKVTVVFGTYSSSLSLAATQVTELAGVPYFELGAISDPITERGFKNLFRTNPTARDFAASMVDAIGEAIAPALGVDAKSLKVAIIHEDSLYGQTVAMAAIMEELSERNERARSSGGAAAAAAAAAAVTAAIGGSRRRNVDESLPRAVGAMVTAAK